MKHRTYILLISFLFAFSVKGQGLDKNAIIGDWGMCQNFDNPDTTCSEPYRIMTFNADGTCQYGSFIINNEKIPVIGKWAFNGKSITIKFDKHPNFSVGDQVYKDIVSFDEDTFFSKVKSKVEYPGHWSYTTFKRIK